MITNRPTVLVLTAMFAFSMMAFFTREANADVLTIATWRAILVAVLFGIAAFWKKEMHGVFEKNQLRTSIPYGLFLALASSTFVGGYAFTTVANTIFLHNLAPVFAIPLAWYLFSDNIDQNIVIGALLGLFGVAMISGVSLFHLSHFTNPKYLLGDFLSIISAIGYAGVLVWTKKSRKEDLPILGTLFVAWTAAALLLTIISLATGSLSVSGSSLLWILGLAFFCTNLPFYLLNKGMKDVSAGMASLLSMSEVLFATMLGAWVYQESLAPIGWVGGILVALGVLYPFLQTKTKNQPTDKPRHPEEWIQLRHQRAGFWLIVVNAAAIWGIYTGDFLFALIGMISLIRVSETSLESLLEGQFSLFRRSLFVFLSICLLYVIAFRTPETIRSVSMILPCLFVLLVDRYLGKKEEELTLMEFGIGYNHVQPILVTTQIPLIFLVTLIVAQASDHQSWHIINWLLLGALGYSTLEGINQHIKQRTLKPGLRLFTSNRLIGLAIVLYGIGGIYIIPAGNNALVERFGVFQSQHDPGLLIQFPPPIDEVLIQPTDQLRSAVVWSEEQSLLCGDQSMISIKANLQYSIENLESFINHSSNTEKILLQEARSLLVNHIRQLPQEDILSGQRNTIEDELTAQLQERSTKIQLGLKVEAFQLTQVSVPSAIKDAFLDVISASEEKNTTINIAEAYAASALPKAFGLATDIHYQAQNEVMSISTKAIQWTSRHNAIHNGAGSGISLVLDNLRQQNVARTIRQPIIKWTNHPIYIGESALRTILQSTPKKEDP